MNLNPWEEQLKELSSGKKYVLDIQLYQKFDVSSEIYSKYDTNISFLYSFLFIPYEPNEIFNNNIENGIRGYTLGIEEDHSLTILDVHIYVDNWAKGLEIEIDGEVRKIKGYSEYDGKDIISFVDNQYFWANDRFNRKRCFLNYMTNELLTFHC